MRAENVIEPAAGRLLVATHDLTDPNFHGTVVLLLDHDDDGSVGLVLNRPSDTAVSEPLPACHHDVADPPVVFVGGPVRRDVLVTLGACHVPNGRVEEDPAWQPVSDGIGIVDLDQPIPADLGSVRIFAGYAGWGAGQLADEVAEGAWWVVDSAVDDPVTADPAGLWRRVLNRQGGLFTTVPEDPAMN